MMFVYPRYMEKEMRRATERDILSCLSFTEWKATLNVLYELRSLLGVTSIFRGPNSGWLHQKLEGLERKSLVERLEVAGENDPDQKRVASRGGRGHVEWKLTSSGLRKKNELPMGEKIPVGVLVLA